MVERYLPGLTAGEVAAAVERMTAMAEEMAAEGMPIRHLSSAFIPEEEACFCQFEAPSDETLALANDRAAFPYARIVQIEPFAAAGTEAEPRRANP